MKASSKLTIDISTASIFRVIAVLLALWFLYFVRDIIAVIFVSIILAATISPIVDRMHKNKIPRALSITIIYLLILTIFGAIIYFVLPPMVSQLKDLAEKLPIYFKVVANFLISVKDTAAGSQLLSASQSGLNSLSNFFSGFMNNIFSTTIGFFSGAAAFVMVFMMTLYFLLDENGIKKFFVSLLPIKQKGHIVNIANKIGVKLGNWFRGQIFLAITVGVIVYIGMLAMKMPYALTLGILAGVLEIVPIIGPIIASIPAILVAFTISPVMALIVTGFYILVQELENKLLVPKVMQFAVGLNPITILIVLFVGSKLMGVLGIFLSVPLASVIYVMLEEWPLMDSAKKA